jgi:small subunit ribosomal protein S14
MAKKSVVIRNKKRINLNQKYHVKRREIKLKIMDKDLNISIFDKIKLSADLSSLPRNSSKVRIRNRCFVTGRARGYYRYFNLSRLSLRDMASFAMLPGVFKESF